METASEVCGGTLGSVAIVGAGVSGLAAAYRLKAAGAAVTIFEGDDCIGGKIKSLTGNGITWEQGPNTMVSNQNAMNDADYVVLYIEKTENDERISGLIDDLGLRSKQQFPVEQKKRYIMRNAKPVLLPSNPFAFVTSELFSSQAKLRVLMEPFLWKRRSKTAVEDESVGDFMERHFGREVVDYAVDPFVAGTSGSDPASISMRYSFPELWALERSNGSLLIGALKSLMMPKTSPRGSVKRQRGSFSFMGGMQTLTNALALGVGEENVNLNSFVTSIACNQQGNPARDSWNLKSSENKNSSDKLFDAVVMTAPLHDFKKMEIVKEGKVYSLDTIPQAVYEPLSVLITLFKKDAVSCPLKGFGVLVPSKEQRYGFQTLGTLFSSSMFPDRAPPDELLLTTFIGGSRNRTLAAHSREDLLEIAMKDLDNILDVKEKPIAIRHVYWEKAFPRYSLGYGKVVSCMEKLEEDLPGFFYAGNQRDGLAVGKCILSGLNAAEHVLSYLNSSGGSKVFTMA